VAFSAKINKDDALNLRTFLDGIGNVFWRAMTRVFLLRGVSVV
jgi:hypothetical protein